MEMKKKLILDIRYYESGATLPKNLGAEYIFSIDTESAGVRIARKLREYGFVLGTYDHLYIIFTDKLPNKQIKTWSRVIDPRISCVDYGISPISINKMSKENQLKFLYEATFDVLNHLARKDKIKAQLIDRVMEDIHNYKNGLEILHKQKDTSSYSLSISYQVKPNGGKSVGWILYIDKQTQWSGKIQFIELENYQDIFFLISSISVSNGVIHLKPRNSFKAKIWNKRYSVPILIPLERLRTA